MPGIRAGTPADLPHLRGLLKENPEAEGWSAEDFLTFGLLVAERADGVAGCLVWQLLVPGEGEILYLATTRQHRRQGVARELVKTLLEQVRGTVFLEVRESNEIARKFYKSMGFQWVATRSNYYNHPPEAAIVLKFHSC